MLEKIKYFISFACLISLCLNLTASDEVLGSFYTLPFRFYEIAVWWIGGMIFSRSTQISDAKYFFAALSLMAILVFPQTLSSVGLLQVITTILATFLLVCQPVNLDNWLFRF